MRPYLLLGLLLLAACEDGARSAPFGPRGTALPPPDPITGAVQEPPAAAARR